MAAGNGQGAWRDVAGYQLRAVEHIPAAPMTNGTGERRRPLHQVLAAVFDMTGAEILEVTGLPNPTTAANALEKNGYEAAVRHGSLFVVIAEADEEGDE